MYNLNIVLGFTFTIQQSLLWTQDPTPHVHDPPSQAMFTEKEAQYKETVSRLTADITHTENELKCVKEDLREAQVCRLCLKFSLVQDYFLELRFMTFNPTMILRLIPYTFLNSLTLSAIRHALLLLLLVTYFTKIYHHIILVKHLFTAPL